VTHANAPLTPLGRLRLAQLIVDKGWSARRAAERFQVSPATAAKWAARYQAGEPMTDVSSRPRSCPTRSPQRLERRIIKLRYCRRWGPHRISYHLRVPRSTVGRDGASTLFKPLALDLIRRGARPRHFPSGADPRGVSGKSALSSPKRPENVRDTRVQSRLPANATSASAQVRACFLRESLRFDERWRASVLNEKVRGSNPLSSTKCTCNGLWSRTKGRG